MGTYIVRRLIQAIPMLIIVSIFLFILVNIAPGGPMSAYSRSNRIPEEKKEAIRRSFGLDKPLPVQYVIWLVGNDWMEVDTDGDGIPDFKDLDSKLAMQQMGCPPGCGPDLSPSFHPRERCKYFDQGKCWKGVRCKFLLPLPSWGHTP